MSMVRDAQLLGPRGRMQLLGVGRTAHNAPRRGPGSLYGIGAGGQWSGVVEKGLDIFGGIFGGKDDDDDDQQPIVINMPAPPPPFPWKPVLIGGGVLIAAYMFLGRRGRR